MGNAANNWPKDVIVPLAKPFTDARGAIQTLADAPLQAAQLITSKKGTVRANHYHKEGWHYCYVVSGSIDYYHRPVGNKDQPEQIHIKTGQVFFTPPMVEHAMVFPEDTVFLNLAGNKRDQQAYEDDLVRVELVKV